MFAIIRVGNKQYKVAAKDVITVDLMDGKEGDTVELTDVLLIEDGKKVTVGKPLIKGAKVTAKILAHERGEKIHVRRFKSKVRYRRHTGFRADLTRLEIVSIA